jgi:putative sterol carrier protein
METTTPAPAPDPRARIEEIFRAFETKGAASAPRTATFRFQLEGEGGGSHQLSVGPERVAWQPDATGAADVTVRLSVNDFLAIADGNFDGRLAVASERIEIAGDMEAAEQILTWIEGEDR